MGKEILTFGDIDVENVLVSNEIYFGDNRNTILFYKYFVGYWYDDYKKSHYI